MIEGAVLRIFRGALLELLFTLLFPFIAPLARLGITAVSTEVRAASSSLTGNFGDDGIDDLVGKSSAEVTKGSPVLFVVIALLEKVG